MDRIKLDYPEANWLGRVTLGSLMSGGWAVRGQVRGDGESHYLMSCDSLDSLRAELSRMGYRKVGESQGRVAGINEKRREGFEVWEKGSRCSAKDE